MIKEFRLSVFISSILMSIVGVILIIMPKMSIRVICYCIAFAFLVFALTRLFYFLRYKSEEGSRAMGNLIAAIFVAIIAFFFFLKPITIAQIIPMLLGVIILVDGIALLISGLIYRAFLPKKGVLSIIIGLASIVLAFVAITNPFATQLFLMEFIGIALLCTGVMNLINHIMVERAESAKNDATTVSFKTEPYDQKEKK